MSPYVTFVILLSLLSIAKAHSNTFRAEGMAEHRKRSSDIRCVDANRICRNVTECKLALKKIRTKCYLNQATCREEEDLKSCNKARQTIFEHGFPRNKKCNCGGNFRRWQKLSNMIYANPCFDNIDAFLHEHRPDDESPKKPQSFSNTSPESVTVYLLPEDDKSTDDKKLTDDEESSAKTEAILELDPAIPTEEIFGDSGFHKTRPPVRHVLRFDPQLLRKTMPTIKASSTPAPMDTTVLTPEEIDATTVAKTLLDVLRENLMKEQSQITTDMKYRIVSIVIGSLFLFVVFVGIICFAGKRIYRSTMPYKRGKIIHHQQKRDASVVS